MPRHLYKGAHSLQSPRTRALMVGLYDLSKKGRSSRALQFTNKLTSEELKVTGTTLLLANQWYIIYENECNLFAAIRQIPRG